MALAKDLGVVSCSDEGVLGEGPTPCDIMIAGIAPGGDEWKRTKRPYTGPAGQLLAACLKTVGHELKGDIYGSNLLCWWKDDPTPAELEACQHHWLKEFYMVQPKLLVTIGQIPGDFLLPSQKRGAVQWSKRFNCWTMRTVHPAAMLRKENQPLIFDFMRDLQKLTEILTWPQDKAHVDFEILDNPEQVQQLFDRIQDLPYDEDHPVSIDIETRYKTGNEILCLSISAEFGTYAIPTSLMGSDVVKQLTWPRAWWVMQGGLFDKRKLSELLGVDLYIHEDTLLQDYSIDERGGQEQEENDDRKVGVHGLKSMAQEYEAAPAYGIKDIEGTWDKGPEGRAKVLEYNALDAAYTRRISMHHRTRQEADNVRQVYKDIMIPSANAFSIMRQHGMLISRHAMAELAVEWIPQAMQLEEELRLESGIDNLNSSKQISDYVYDDLGLVLPQITKNRLAKEKTKSGRTTNKTAIEAMNHPWLDKLKHWRQLDHLIGTYITGIEDDIEEDGRIHPDPILHGTRTGRLAYHNPPIQTIPKHGEELAKIRKLFVAPPGSEIIEADYRQAELWVAYFHSKDPALLASLETGDFHAATTLKVFDVGPEHKDFDQLRYESKRITFGIFYRRKARSLYNAFGHTLKFWDDAIAKWANEYHVYWDYRDTIMEEVKRNGEQTSVSGRKRRYWIVWDEQALNQAVNMPIQTMAHEHLLMSVNRFVLEQRLAKYGAYPLCEIHDSILFESPIANRQEVVKEIRRTMEEPMFGFPRGLQVDIMVSNGKSWYDTVKYKD